MVKKYLVCKSLRKSQFTFTFLPGSNVTSEFLQEKRGPKKKRGRPGRPKKGSFGPLSVQIKPKRKNEAQNESMDHDYHHPKTDYKLMSKQDLIDHIEQLEAKVAILSKENELYKKKDKETIWVSMNSMKKKPLQGKLFLIFCVGTIL